jgi:hypothetical protein|nr:MAG TPA: hypothetical protein [Caudoviricetes sp.]
MKARVKSTGVLVDVTPQLNINSQHSKDYLYVCGNMVFKECELDFSAIDWEQRRYELAKSAMQGILSDEEEVRYACSEADYKKGEVRTIPKSIAQFAIACADALINDLKGE